MNIIMGDSYKHQTTSKVVWAYISLSTSKVTMVIATPWYIHIYITFDNSLYFKDVIQRNVILYDTSLLNMLYAKLWTYFFTQTLAVRKSEFGIHHADETQ